MGLACTKSRDAAVLTAAKTDGAVVAGDGAVVVAAPSYTSKRRGSVSAEPAAAARAVPKRVIPKAEEAKLRIQDIVKDTMLFSDLDEEQTANLIDAMFERKVEPGEVIIREGDPGDNWYAIESGTFVATKDGEVKFCYAGKGSFGELALLYNCPRAATITAQSAGVLWALDRATFRSLVVGSMVERRQRHEGTLMGMPIFQHLTHEQLAAIADCLSMEEYQPGEIIIKEGEQLDSRAKFYVVESGRVECYRSFQGKKLLTKQLSAGDVFGEVALLTKQPRQADCVAATHVKCLAMACDAFERLMGPVEEILAKQIAEYNRQNQAGGAMLRSHPLDFEHSSTAHAGSCSVSAEVDVAAEACSGEGSHALELTANKSKAVKRGNARQRGRKACT